MSSPDNLPPFPWTKCFWTLVSGMNPVNSDDRALRNESNHTGGGRMCKPQENRDMNTSRFKWKRPHANKNDGSSTAGLTSPVGLATAGDRYMKHLIPASGVVSSNCAQSSNECLFSNFHSPVPDIIEEQFDPQQYVNVPPSSMGSLSGKSEMSNTYMLGKISSHPQRGTEDYGQHRGFMRSRGHSFDQPRTDDEATSVFGGSSSGYSRNSDGMLSRNSSNAFSERNYRPRTPSSPRALFPPTESLAHRIAADERKRKTERELQRQQLREAERLAEVNEQYEQTSFICPRINAAPTVLKSVSDTLEKLPYLLPMPHYFLAKDDPPDFSLNSFYDHISIMDTGLIHHDDGLSKMPSFETTGDQETAINDKEGFANLGRPSGSVYEQKVAQNIDSSEIYEMNPQQENSVKLKLSPSVADMNINISELPDNSLPHAAELASRTSILAKEIDGDGSVFSDLRLLVSALPSPRQSMTPGYPSSEQCVPWNSTRRPQSPIVELPPLLDTPPPPYVCELSTSESVIHRPHNRLPVQQLYKRSRLNSRNLTIYNTLPAEPYPLHRQSDPVELPTRSYEVDRRDIYDSNSTYSGPPVTILPDLDPRTGRPWAGAF